MQTIDWIILSSFFVILLAVGVFSFRMIKNSKDFFIAGGKIPWWLAGVSHHVSGYSGVVFVAYAGLAYTHGFSLYVWWAFTIAVGITVGAFIIAPRWSMLRDRLNIQSPTEYLSTRYNLQTQQIIAWSGVFLKLFDIGAKWAAIAILLNGFTGVPLTTGILLSGGVSMIYVTIGGLWADVMNDFAQFVVQIIAGITMFVVVLAEFGGLSAVWEMRNQLPPGNTHLFNEPYTPLFAFAFLLIHFLSYNGGTWNLAMRYISSPTGRTARKAAILSALLYLFWPLVLFVPMWLAPIILPNLADPTKSYAMLARQLLPPGLVGLVLAGMFANTMSMTASDSNTVSSVLTRDILPKIFPKINNLNQKQALLLARLTTFTFTFLTIIIAINADVFGGVIGLIILWFGALIGPVAIPMIFGLLPVFRYSDSRAAILSISSGFAAFIATKYVLATDQVLQVASPVITAFIFYTGTGLINRIYVKKKSV